MSLWHATHRAHLKSIYAHGLLTRYSTGEFPAIWAVGEARQQWAVLHACERHGWTLADMVTLCIQPRAVKWRRNGTGLYYSLTDVPPNCISSVKPWDWLAARERVANRQNGQ